jgi:hypothetical protein
VSDIAVDIERIVLPNGILSSTSIERFGEMVEFELQRMLSGSGLAGIVNDGDIARVRVPAMGLTSPHSDSYLASRIAQRIVDGIRIG